MNENFFKASAYINGKFVDTEDTLEVYSAIDGSCIGSLPCLKKNHVDVAYEGANRAFKIWKNISHEMRIRKIKEFAQIFIKEKEYLATLMTLEIGKPYNDSIKEIERSYEYILETIKIYQNEFLNPVVINSYIHGIEGKVGKFYREPIGVVLAISPFNYPINLSISKIIPAILFGNTVVFKPATQGALVASQLAKYFEQAQIIPGVFNLVIGKGSEIGDYIVENERIAGATFTGSTTIGKKIAQKITMKPLVLEMGGKDVAIVSKFANLELAAKEIIKGAYNFSGQRCTAIKRILVQEEISYDFIKLLKDEIWKLTVGDPFQNVDVVPLIDKKTLDYNLDLINDAISYGGQIIHGGKVIGYNLLEPTLIDNVSLKSRIAWEEPFGPLLPIIHVKNMEEAIQITNDSEYGLQGSIFSENKEEIEMLVKNIETGTININRSSSRGPDIFPFTGIKNSGFGVQGIRDSLLAMTRIKGVVYND